MVVARLNCGRIEIDSCNGVVKASLNADSHKFCVCKIRTNTAHRIADCWGSVCFGRNFSISIYFVQKYNNTGNSNEHETHDLYAQISGQWTVLQQIPQVKYLNTFPYTAVYINTQILTLVFKYNLTVFKYLTITYNNHPVKNYALSLLCTY